MVSLKEIRGRINSVSATLKITDVNRMISSAKLHKVQSSLNSFSFYKESILSTFHDLVDSLTETDTVPLMAKKSGAKRVLIISFSSNTGLCGSFNSNVIKRTGEMIKHYRSESSGVTLYSIGKKVFDGFLHNTDIALENISEIYDRPSYTKVSEVAEKIIAMYLNGEVDEVMIVYNRFKNILTQYISEKKLLPLTNGVHRDSYPDYIMEPDRKTLVDTLAPQVVKLIFYETFLESLAAEYGARASAMQAATDNANDLLGELSAQYNKVRQSAITGELIDIVGGSEALK
jgi:F-type H+-transporting ATPase subunit gamma